jgi:pimeloyl-ACP methyl ester carboxylesterase
MQLLPDRCSSAGRAETLLVLLPPAESRLEDFHTQGFVSAVRDRGIQVDLLLAAVTYQHVTGRTAMVALQEHVVQPARAAGYRDIWLAGISLGAFNALHYAAECADQLAGLVLLAPYPGTGDILAEIVQAGGPAAWSRTALADQGDERTWWRWLCRQADCGQWPTPVYFGTGTEDRFWRGQRLLADLLPVERVHQVSGPHAWPTWLALWQDWLDRGPFAAGRLRGEAFKSR